jgi:hypothetical protein
MREQPGVTVIDGPQPGWGRYLSLEKALESAPDQIHYADLDRLLHWVETQPDEWRRTVEAIQHTDCLIMGRTDRAFATHPRVLQQTEKIINAVASELLGRAVDVCGGSRGLTRHAAEYLCTHSAPGNWGDARWPIMLQQAGFAVDYVALEGLEWESADRYRERAADADTIRAVADAYDRDVAHWAMRVEVAAEIVQEALAAARESPQ